jgi:hypothetical protein
VIRHFTATAFIIDSKKRTLLLWHKRYIQPNNMLLGLSGEELAKLHAEGIV